MKINTKPSKPNPIFALQYRSYEHNSFYFTDVFCPTLKRI